MFNYPLSKFASQDGSLNFPREAEIHLFRRDFSLIYQTRPSTMLDQPKVIGELGAANHCYCPLLFPRQRSRLPRVHLAMSTGTYVPKFVNWAPLGENIIRRKKEGNVGFRAHPGHDPSP